MKQRASDVETFVAQMIVQQQTMNLGLLGADAVWMDFLHPLAQDREINMVDLTPLPVARWAHGGEYFETIVIFIDIIEDEKALKALKKALLKNNSLIYIASKPFEPQSLLRLEALGFSDVSLLEFESTTIYLIKKWFTFES